MIVKLEDVCFSESSNLKQSDVTETTNGYPVYGASGFIGNIDKYKQEKEYISIVKDGAGVGRVQLCPGKSSVIGTMQYIIPKENILPKYLYYVTTYMHLEKYYTGATIPHIYFKDYKKEKFHLDSIEKQENIINILNKCCRMIELRKKQLQEYDSLIKARFVEMFGGIHDSKAYPYELTKNLCDVISGGTPNREKSEYWEKGDIPWIRTADLQNKVIQKSVEYITKKGLDNSAAKLVPPDTILIAMYGQGKTRGMTGYLNIEASTNQACACILPGNKINPIFMWKYYELSYEKLRRMAKGGNQPNLNGNMIKDFLVLSPPIELQNQFAAFVIEVDKSKLAVQKSLEKTQQLFDSLMQEYFG